MSSDAAATGAVFALRLSRSAGISNSPLRIWSAVQYSGNVARSLSSPLALVYFSVPHDAPNSLPTNAWMLLVVCHASMLKDGLDASIPSRKRLNRPSALSL